MTTPHTFNRDQFPDLTTKIKAIWNTAKSESLDESKDTDSKKLRERFSLGQLREPRPPSPWKQRGDEARKLMQDKLDKSPGIVARWRKDAAAARAKKNVREDYDDMEDLTEYKSSKGVDLAKVHADAKKAGKKVSLWHGEGDTLYKVVNGKKKASGVKEDIQIDELSGALKSRYIKAAAHDAVNRTAAEVRDDTLDHKTDKRVRGIRRAASSIGDKTGSIVKNVDRAIRFTAQEPFAWRGHGLNPKADRSIKSVGKTADRLSKRIKEEVLDESGVQKLRRVIQSIDRKTGKPFLRNNVDKIKGLKSAGGKLDTKVFGSMAPRQQREWEVGMAAKPTSELGKRFDKWVKGPVKEDFIDEGKIAKLGRMVKAMYKGEGEKNARLKAAVDRLVPQMYSSSLHRRKLNSVSEATRKPNTLVTDRVTGKQYDPEKESAKLFKNKKFIAQMKRMKKTDQ